MSIEINYNKTVKIDRLTDVESGEAGQEKYAENLSAVPCHIQPLEEGYSEDQQGQFGKDWLMFCDYNDILEGDRVRDGSTEYRVVGVEKFTFLGEPRHMELRIRLFNQ